MTAIAPGAFSPLVAARTQDPEREYSAPTPERLPFETAVNYPQWLSDSRHFLVVKGRITHVADID